MKGVPHEQEKMDVVLGRSSGLSVTEEGPSKGTPAPAMVEPGLS